MIRVEKQPEPRAPGFDFDGRVRQPGLSALAELIGDPPTVQRTGPRIKPRATRVEDLPPSTLRKYHYWTRALDALHAAYGGRCAYASFYIEPLTGPTVDHFVAICRAEPQEAYEWGNYRLACSLMNSRKNDFAGVLDPCEIEDGWFTLDLDTFDVVPGEGLDDSLRQRARETIDHLLNTPECKSMRRRYFELHWAPKDPTRPIPLWFIEEQAPFLAREMRRQGRVRSEELERAP